MSEYGCLLFWLLELMLNKFLKNEYWINFFIGVLVFTLFIIGVLLIPGERKEIIEDKNETDVMDYDGIGNYGRIPNKDS